MICVSKPTTKPSGYLLLKDYYVILGLPRNASSEEIKKAFRKQALVYHPDKQKEGMFGLAKYAEIQEAYQVLRDGAKRAAYTRQLNHYSAEQVRNPLPVTASDLLAEIHSLLKILAVTDPFRLNMDSLYHSLAGLTTEYHIQLLQKSESDYSARFIDGILFAAKLLPYPNLKTLEPALLKIAAGDDALHKRIVICLRLARWQNLWHRYKTLIAFFIALFFCFLLYKFAR